MRGYCGIGIVAGKSPQNIGTLWRSAHAMGAAFIFTVGHRYPKQPSDTTKAWRSVPLYEHGTTEELVASLPRACKLIGVECDDGRRYAPESLVRFAHPERAVYLLGAEDRGLTTEDMERCDSLVEIPATYCLNVATAGSILLYDRNAKAGS